MPGAALGLYDSPGSSSLALHIAPIEAGLPFEAVRVDEHKPQRASVRAALVSDPVRDGDRARPTLLQGSAARVP